MDPTHTCMHARTHARMQVSRLQAALASKDEELARCDEELARAAELLGQAEGALRELAADRAALQARLAAAVEGSGVVRGWLGGGRAGVTHAWRRRCLAAPVLHNL